MTAIMQHTQTFSAAHDRNEIIRELACRIGMDRGRGTFPETTPFSAKDLTCGAENELQAAVAGGRQSVDLPRTIEQSNFYANIKARARAGEVSRSTLQSLEDVLAANTGTWENSWISMELASLGEKAQQCLSRDLTVDKGVVGSGPRPDHDRYLQNAHDTPQLRIPVSYLLKLALIDFLDREKEIPLPVRRLGEQAAEHFSNDNTSPETFSFYVVTGGSGGSAGQQSAGETALRFLVSHLLTVYGNQQFGLRDSGQEAMVYFAPHPPIWQQRLNDRISDSFYRELFMSPCLSGWDRGWDKHLYMSHCHRTLSRSKLNTLARLRETGIINSNLVVLPNTSNVSLANNGTHVSLGSKMLTRLMADGAIDQVHEKCALDLVIKIMEHFLPLFVGTFSAAPFRLDFADFHPERVLGFLPHELDGTHLRMIWRRWRKKARNTACGRPITPFGPKWLDRFLSGVLRLKGDMVPDIRLVDYLACLPSTSRSPALDGRIGNSDRLRQDLADLGIFDPEMALYLFIRQREYGRMGFSGLEGRYYSLFPSLLMDMADAVDLQASLTALAFHLAVSGAVTHEHIPDDPYTESERRQVVFQAAIGLPTFFVRRDSGNHLLREIMARTGNVRQSKRYRGFLRVHVKDYRLALLRFLRQKAPEQAERSRMDGILCRLERMIAGDGHETAHGRLTSDFLRTAAVPSPFSLNADQFNSATETHYRETLKNLHLEEGLETLRKIIDGMKKQAHSGDNGCNAVLHWAADGNDPLVSAAQSGRELFGREQDPTAIKRLLRLALAAVHHRSTRHD